MDCISNLPVCLFCRPLVVTVLTVLSSRLHVLNQPDRFGLCETNILQHTNNLNVIRLKCSLHQVRFVEQTLKNKVFILHCIKFHSDRP